MPEKKTKKESERLEILIPEDDENREIKIKICGYLMDGMWKKDAATLAGIDRTTLYRWIKEDATFATWVEASILFYKRLLIKDLSFGYKSGNPETILRARWPLEWNTAKKIAMVDPQKELAKTLAILEGEDIEEGEVMEGGENDDPEENSGGAEAELPSEDQD